MDQPEPTHLTFLKTLSAERKRELTKRSDTAGLLHLAGHWGLIAAVGYLIHLGVPGWQMLLPVEGILIVFNFTLLHETTHSTPFRSRWLNELVGRITGFAVGIPFLWFRYFHFAHHKYTNDPARDPELLGTAKPSDIRTYVWQMSGIPQWYSLARTLLRIALRGADDDFVPKSARRRVQIEAQITCLTYLLVLLSLYFTSVISFIYLFLMYLFGQSFLRFYLMAEHADCPKSGDMFENSRTTLTNRVVRFLAWNMPFHAEHHCFPSVPFFRLPDLHSEVRNQLKTVEHGYAGFHFRKVRSLSAK